MNGYKAGRRQHHKDRAPGTRERRSERRYEQGKHERESNQSESECGLARRPNIEQYESSGQRSQSRTDDVREINVRELRASLIVGPDTKMADDRKHGAKE